MEFTDAILQLPLVAAAFGMVIYVLHYIAKHDEEWRNYFDKALERLERREAARFEMLQEAIERDAEETRRLSTIILNVVGTIRERDK